MSEPVSIPAFSITLKRYQCRHIFTDGRRCGSPCLKQEEFCYYHHTTRRAAARPRTTEAEQAEFDLPLAEDRSAIQISIGEVLRRIARNEIDPRRAGLLLYGLQIASLNIARAAEPVRDTELIEEITADPELGTVAPAAELVVPEKQKGFAQTMIEEFQRQREERREEVASRSLAPSPAPFSGDPTVKPTVIPRIQACHRKRPPSRREAHPDRKKFCEMTGTNTTLSQTFLGKLVRVVRGIEKESIGMLEGHKGVTDEWSASSGGYT